VLRLTEEGREARRRALATYRHITRDGLSGIDSGQDGLRLMAAAAILAGGAPMPMKSS
jgi:hypothetical protein